MVRGAVPAVQFISSTNDDVTSSMLECSSPALALPVSFKHACGARLQSTILSCGRPYVGPLHLRYLVTTKTCKLPTPVPVSLQLSFTFNSYVFIATTSEGIAGPRIIVTEQGDNTVAADVQLAVASSNRTGTTLFADVVKSVQDWVTDKTGKSTGNLCSATRLPFIWRPGPRHCTTNKHTATVRGKRTYADAR